ncbi:MAG: hypothetical protein RL033_2947 [Pseudomonadota bacterium]
MSGPLATPEAGAALAEALLGEAGLGEAPLKDSPPGEEPPAEALSDRAGGELSRIQRRLEQIYQLEPGPCIVPFVCVDSDERREQLIVRQSSEALELVVMLPEASLKALIEGDASDEMDAYLGAVEGISHFIHIAERVRTRLPTTLLELELQAEVDKFAILADGSQHAAELPELHRRLYENVRYLHSARSEQGERYRLANDLAAKLWSSLIAQGQSDRTQLVLRRFYRASQAEKIRMVRAA